ncbi:aspartate-alanine antiporter-like transporter [Alkaliphilus oremlandii]|uniref:YidE/YbjL duplication n=1 Tax=Alkaliphilus oremlandii (strain OhILAs) TaxID=350688 RepID=A8MM15_ALKOO|nr:YidE/YbjL duplication [Alkaliphilus oremlandii OhILAs]
MLNAIKFVEEPLLLLFCSILIGQVIGRISCKGFKLGSAGALFSGIAISYFATQYLMMVNVDHRLLKSGLIPSELFQLSLTGFIAAVGLLASQNIGSQIKENGYKFMLLALVTTGTGALSTWLFFHKISSISKISIIGTYPGALTSSPTLATAIELATALGNSSEVLVGLGYTISYIPAVIIIVISVQLLSKYYNGNHSSCKLNSKKQEIGKGNFSVIGFVTICLLGTGIGKIEVYLGAYLGLFSLGATGGVLLSALVLGNLKKIGFINFRMDDGYLAVVRDISLNIFLATVGLNYGYSALNLIRVSGVQLLAIGATTTLSSILVGYILGKKVLKLSTINIIGGICGSMTSTPGLCAAMESLESDEVVAGYGAAYPFGLFLKILFINILFRL